MTSYSLYATNLMRLTVEGDLPTDEDTADDYTERMVSCLAAGAARMLLDNTTDTDEDGTDREVNAVEWHTPNEGWELDALDDELRAVVEGVCRRMLTERFHQVVGLANDLAWKGPDQEVRALWFHDFGMALYRVGGLLGYTLAGAGIGFYDYDYPSANALKAWVNEVDLGGSIETFLDGAEEPCLLHASVSAAVRVPPNG